VRAISGVAFRVMSLLVSRRKHLPRSLNRLIDDVAKNPDGVAGKLAARVLGGASEALVPAATSVPETSVRVYIGPTNYAGQGFLWARALERADASVGARNMAIELPAGFAFPADSLVPIAVQTASVAWQRAEFEAAAGFTHVLFEAQRSLFGPLFGRSVGSEIEHLQERGVSCAFICHGTDIRSPRLHRQRDPLSPYIDDPQSAAHQAEADANLALLRAHTLPIFVSTPDLLIDVPEAAWCPVVVDTERWKGAARQLLQRKVPVVVHLPSMGTVKGTHLIEPMLHRLHEAGTIEYRGLTGIPSSKLPGIIGDADIVLDQFRIGSYGVAAVEAMAASRVVVGHVLMDVRQSVAALTELELPIVEADPDSLEAVLLGLIADPDRMGTVANAGCDFADVVHSGSWSARVLIDNWAGERTSR
jgi:hypothetical protein